MEFGNGITSRRHSPLCAKCWACRSNTIQTRIKHVRTAKNSTSERKIHDRPTKIDEDDHTYTPRKFTPKDTQAKGMPKRGREDENH